MTLLSNITPDFRSSGHPIEIFCPKDYHGYHVRGQITHFMDQVYAPDLPGGCAYGQYLLAILILLRNDLRAVARIIPSNYGRFGTFFGKTVPELRAIQREMGIHNLPRVRNKPLIIPIADINIAQTPYLSAAIKQHQKIILLKIDLCLHTVFQHSPRNPILTSPKSIHPLLAHGFFSNPSEDYVDPSQPKLNSINKIREHLKKIHAGTADQDGENVPGFFSRLYDIIHNDLNYDLITKDEYLKTLTAIGSLSHEGLKPDIITKKFCATFNRLKKNATKNQRPLDDFFFKFLGDLENDLVQRQKVLRCPECNQIFPFKTGITYCQKRCQTSCAGKRYYAAHAEVIKPRAKVASQRRRDRLRA